MGTFSLLIASAYYENKAYSHYITSLVNSLGVLREAGIKHSYISISGDAYVDRAKNGLVDIFLKSEYTHMMLIDSDIEWDVEGFGRLLKAAMAGAEVVAGAYRVKGDYTEYAVSPVVEDGQYVGNNECGFPVIKVLSFPGGFVIYSRKAFERTKPVVDVYDMDGPVSSFFKIGTIQGGDINSRVGEDIYFQRKYMAQGGIMYLVPDINLTHWGIKGYDSNYDREMRRHPGGCDYEDLIERLRGKHKDEICWIIGKGQSLQYLKKEDIGKGPVIAINEAIIKVESLGLDNPIYSMQKDQDDPLRDSIGAPKHATLLVQPREVPNRHNDYRPRYIFDNPIDFDTVWNTCSSVTVCYIAELFGCRNLVFCCFDAADTGDLSYCHYSEDGTYAIYAESDPEEDKRQYKRISLGLKRHVTKRYLAAQWFTPKEICHIDYEGCPMECTKEEKQQDDERMKIQAGGGIWN